MYKELSDDIKMFDKKNSTKICLAKNKLNPNHNISAFYRFCLYWEYINCFNKQTI